ncbi:MAG: hypothetical protein ACK5L3_14405 [Oscillospiraceae bacterium]
MTKVKLGKKEWDILNVQRSSGLVSGIHRDLLILHIPMSVISFDELFKMVQDKTITKAITTTRTDPNDPEAPVSTVAFENYTVNAEPIISVQEATSMETGEVAQVYVVILGKLTLVEQQNEAILAYFAAQGIKLPG